MTSRNPFIRKLRKSLSWNREYLVANELTISRKKQERRWDHGVSRKRPLLLVPLFDELSGEVALK